MPVIIHLAQVAFGEWVELLRSFWWLEHFRFSAFIPYWQVLWRALSSFCLAVAVNQFLVCMSFLAGRTVYDVFIADACQCDVTIRDVCHRHLWRLVVTWFISCRLHAYVKFSDDGLSLLCCNDCILASWILSFSSFLAKGFCCHKSPFETNNESTC